MSRLSPEGRRVAGLTLVALLVVLWFALIFAAPAAAQTILNPTRVSFGVSPDHARVDRYEGGYFAVPVLASGTCDAAGAPAPMPVQADDLGKPADAAGTIDTALGAATLPSRPLGCYRYKVRAFGSGLWGEWSDPSGPFGLTARAPTDVTVRR